MEKKVHMPPIVFQILYYIFLWPTYYQRLLVLKMVVLYSKFQLSSEALERYMYVGTWVTGTYSTDLWGSLGTRNNITSWVSSFTLKFVEYFELCRQGVNLIRERRPQCHPVSPIIPNSLQSLSAQYCAHDALCAEVCQDRYPRLTCSDGTTLNRPVSG